MVTHRSFFPALLSLLLLANSLSLGAPAEKAKGDSVETLKFFLERELKHDERLFILKNAPFSDSLIKGQRSLTETQLQNLVRDSAMVEEIKSQIRFRNYWAKVEKESGIGALKAQYAARDPDRSRIPKLYLADSSIVILPGWIVVRKH